MSRPDLSAVAIAGVLAVLGSSACSKRAENANPASVTNEPARVAPTPSASAQAAPPPPLGTTSGVPSAVAGGSATDASAPAQPIMRAPGAKPSPGQASCGAGTCAADPKKKK